MVSTRRIVCLCASLCGLFLGFSLLAKPGGFYLDSLPRGKDVTLPRPAISFVSINDRVTVSATDMPQTIKLSSVNVNDGKPVSFRVAIYDSKAEKVKHVNLKPGASYLYSFKDLSTISIVPEAPAGKGMELSSYSLRLESDKPLGLSR